MKILAFVDTHLDEKAIKQIIKKSKKVDIVICAGDISWLGQGTKEALFDLSKKIKKNIYIIPGNHETNSELIKVCEKKKNLIYVNKRLIKLEDYYFFFWGGGGFAERDKNLEKRIPKLKKKLTKKDQLIFITHGPPYKTKLDILEYIGHVGCKSQKKFIKELKPLVHICGHIHENSEVQQVIYKRTLIINPGPAGKILEI
ncbi:MAG: metallophosphoesterase family protein [Nanoarchaeota archaeon]|nr:metallophosphoesterase family protein [Nanoarchaeota archaeon]